MTYTPDLNEKPIPESLIRNRWVEKGLTSCKVHKTWFEPTEEPCWQCYQEVQDGDYHEVGEPK